MICWLLTGFKRYQIIFHIEMYIDYNELDIEYYIFYLTYDL